MSGEEDDQARAERVRSRRSRRGRRDPGEGEQTSGTSGSSQTSQTEGTSQTSQTSGSEETDAPTEPESASSTSTDLASQPIKERGHETFYLREDLQKEIRQVTGEAALQFELAYDVNLEKNRHLRPLLLHLGAQELAELSPGAVREVLDVTDVLDSTDVEDAPDS